jgi:hypothetical protein
VDGAADAASAPRGSLRAAAGVGAGVVVGLVTVLGDVERSDPDQILWIYVARPAIPALTAAILAIPLIARHRRIDGVVLRPVMLLLTGASVTLGLLNWRDQRSSDYREWARASAVAPDPAETDLLEWIAMTPPETVVASASDVVRDPMPRRELVPLVTTIQGYGREPLQRASVAAASGPGCVAASELVAAGADVFVATTEEASVGALDACATRVYENASYVVYDLAKAP